MPSSLLAQPRAARPTGRAVSRETRSATCRSPRPRARRRAASTELEATGRATAPTRPQARDRAAASLEPGGATTSGAYEPVDEEELGVTRRQFFNRGILTGLGLGIGGFGAAALAFLWPTGAGGFGGKVDRRQPRPTSHDDDRRRRAAVLQRRRRKTYIQPYPKDDVPKAEKVYARRRSSRAWSRAIVALYQKCVHLGCRVPWCQTSQWFECPCHGSKYNRVGEKRGGPAPRGLDRFVARRSSGGSITVDTGTIVRARRSAPTPPAKGQEGALRVIRTHVDPCCRSDDPTGSADPRELPHVLIVLNVLAFVVARRRHRRGASSACARNPEPKTPAEPRRRSSPTRTSKGARLERVLGWSLLVRC